jgi:hypothetical protein
LPEDAFDRVIDCKENLVMPAFYNAHCHAAMTLFRGYGEDLPLRRWLDEKILPAEEKLNFRRVHYGTRLAIAEMIKNGVVSFSDMYMFQDATAEAVLEAGVKANLARSIVSFDPDIKPEDDHRFAESIKLVEQYHGAGDGRLKVDMSLHAEYSNVDACCRYVAEYAAENGLRMQLHLSETEKEHMECIERHGMTPAAYFASLGVLDVPTTAAHCVWVSDEDIAILKEKGDTAHDALHDARNTAKVCAHLELEAYLGEYTGRIFALPPTGKRYESRRDMLSDPDLSAFPCPWCGGAVKCEPWISFGHGASAAYGICPEEDEFLLQLHPACHHRDEYSAKRLVFELTDDLWDIYSDKKEAAQGTTP